jgi:hypothetical protein
MYKINETTNKAQNRIMELANPKPEMLDMDQLVSITHSAFGTKVSVNQIKSNLLNVDFLHLIYTSEEEARLIGFASYRTFITYMGRILYLIGVAIDKPEQRNGSFSASICKAIEKAKPDYLATRTQSMVLYHAVSKINGVVYPCLKEPTKDAVRVGSIIAAICGTNDYNKDKFISLSAYPSSLYSSEPETSDAIAKRVFELLRFDIRRWRLSYSCSTS